MDSYVAGLLRWESITMWSNRMVSVTACLPSVPCPFHIQGDSVILYNSDKINWGHVRWERSGYERLHITWMPPISASCKISCSNLMMGPQRFNTSPYFATLSADEYIEGSSLSGKLPYNVHQLPKSANFFMLTFWWRTPPNGRWRLCSHWQLSQPSSDDHNS